MIFTKDNLKLGLALGFGGPLVGLIFSTTTYFHLLHFWSSWILLFMKIDY